MANLGNFDASKVEPASTFEPVPAGKYLAVIAESEMKATRTGTGHYLELTFQIAEGQYKGRKLWARLNLDNPSPQAVQIARGELSAICRATGVMTPRDSAELHGIPLAVKVICRKRDDGEISNELKGFERREAAFSGVATMPGTPPSAPAPQATKATPPWQR